MDKPFLEALQEHTILFDGGMGTEIYAQGVFLNRCYEELNLVRPGVVETVHRSFLQAGADAVETNTFTATRPRLEPHGLGDKVREINAAGARLARAAVGQRAWVAGAMGPLGIRLEPWGPTTFDEAVALFGEQIEGLIDGGVDLLVYETFTDLIEIQAAVRAARTLCDLPIVAMMTVDDQGRTPEGVPPEWMAQKLEATGAEVVGVNCSVGPAPMLSVLELMAGICERPLAAMPNAGVPRSIDGRMLYLSSPAYMSRYAKRFVKLGARVIGGCCGVTPEHIRAMRDALSRSSESEIIPRVIVAPPKLKPRQAVPTPEKSSLARKISGGDFVTLLEVAPPSGWETRAVMDAITPWMEAGLDAVLVPDDPRVSARLSPLALAKLLLESDSLGCGEAAGCEALLQYSCRNRDLMDMQSDLLGIHALGLRNLMLVTGQGPRLGEASWAPSHYDVDAIGLANVAFRLNHGLDVGDSPIGEPTAFYTGVLANVGVPSLDAEVRRFEWKVDAGAEYAVTSPIFDTTEFFRFLERISAVRIPLLVNLRVLRSAREAEYLAGEVPGVALPAEYVERMVQAASRDAELQVGCEIAREVLEKVLPEVQGVLISGLAAFEAGAPDILGGLYGQAIEQPREFPGHPGIMDGTEGRRYER